MEAVPVILGDFFMTRPTGFGGVGIGWIFNDPIMGCFPVRVSRITAVTFMAAELTMIFIFGYFAVHENFFVRGQRLHFSTSSLSFGFSRGPRLVFFGFSKFARDLYQFSWICMTFKTVVFRLGGVWCLKKTNGS
jgi:hypothetical protein